MNTTGDLRRIFKGFVMNPLEPSRVEAFEPGYLVVSGEKVVQLTGADPRAKWPLAEFIDFGKKTILPGFVDTHVHLPQFRIMGTGSGELLAWLNTYTYPEEARFADPAYAASVSQEFFDALVANGTTTAAIYSSVHERATDLAFTAAERKGIRAYIGKVMMDRNSPETLLEDTETSIAASIRLFEKWDGAAGGRLSYVFTPRFAASCSMELMQRTGSLARERGALVQTHLSENREEVEWVRQLFPSYPSYASVYDAAALLTDRSIMAHCIHLSSDEIALLSSRHAHVAFCPYSNSTLRSGTMPYQRLRAAGLNVALGSDVAGGPSLSMLQQMRQAMAAAQIAWTEALFLATLGGATALGIADRIGNFAAGKDADFVVVENDSVEHVYLRGRQVF